MDYVGFSEEHMRGVLRLCEIEGWPSFAADPPGAVRALTAAGVISVVAVEDGEVVGFAQMLTDGEIQAYLCLVAVAPEARGRGIGKKLIEEAFARSGAKRVDLVALDGNQGFYQSFQHRTMPGFRIYPSVGEGDTRGPGIDEVA